ncbi:alpha/beta fold hydrolase [Streptomyces sp. NPDC029216]|uniref:alpha/beta fold hydrolase n=1 Tax=Streptomyces sp. NPDC029216 TaxID=3154701 RepID=UPI00340D47B1
MVPPPHALGRGAPPPAIFPPPGYSTQSREISDADDTAAWLEETLTGLGLERVHLIGHSYGAVVALQHAARVPGRVASVAVYDPPRALAPLKPGFVLGAIAAFASGSEKLQRRWLANLLGETGAAPDQAEAELRLSLEAMRGFRIRLPQPQHMTDEELRSIAAPALVLLGGADRVMDSRRAETRARDLIPDVRTEIVPGAAHGIPVTPFTTRVTEFLHDVEQARTA